MKKGLILVFILLTLPVALASECNDFCEGSGFDFGACKETTEEGFCEGNQDEEVFGFSYCENLERCCCGFDEKDTVEETHQESTSSFEWPDFTSEKGFFWLLLIVVVILGIMVYRKRNKKDVFKELQP